jgi:hypothetical protein
LNELKIGVKLRARAETENSMILMQCALFRKKEAGFIPDSTMKTSVILKLGYTNFLIYSEQG